MGNSRAVIIPLTTLAVIAVAATLRELGGAIRPFVVALFLANVFHPLVRALRRRRVPIPAVLLIVLVVVGSLLASIVLVGYVSVQTLVAALPRYGARWRHDIEPGIVRWIAALPRPARRYIAGINWAHAIQPGQLTEALSAMLNSVFALAGDVAMIMLFMLFILGGDGRFTAKVAVALPKRGPEVVAVLTSIERRTQRYLITNTLVSAANGVAMAALLAALGVDLAPLFGLLAFLLNFIPTIGSVTAALLPMLLALLQFGGSGRALVTAISVAVLQAFFGSYLSPRVMGVSLDIDPLLVLVALVFFGWLWGVWGAILAVPIVSMIKIVFESVPATRPLAGMMGSRAAQAKD
jgi:predicted PurR-regulated permease PerM